MLWLWGSVTSWFGRFCNEVLKVGPIPRHIAVIMDGNRRFAKKNSLDRSQGHLKGFDKLLEVSLVRFFSLIYGSLLGHSM